MVTILDTKNDYHNRKLNNQEWLSSKEVLFDNKETKAELLVTVKNVLYYRSVVRHRGNDERT